MSLITKKNSGQFKVSGLPSVDWANQLSASLMAAFYFGAAGNQVIDLVTGRLFPQTSTSVVSSTTVEGQGLKGVSGGTGGYYIANANIAPTKQLTVFARVNRTGDTPARARIINTQDANNIIANGTKNGYELSWVGGTGNYEFQVGNGSSAITVATIASSTINSPISLMGTFDGSTISLYANAGTPGTASLAGPIVYSSFVTVPPLLFNYAATTGTLGAQNFAGHVYVIYVFNRCLTALDATVLHLNPYGLLVYPQDKIWSSIKIPSNQPSSNTAYINGTAMIQQGTSILKQGTTPLINKGLVYDPLNTIAH